MNQVLVTVFTPTYNRCKYLPNLYHSLLEQTEHAIEWIVVDQGNDQTEELVRGYKDEAPFPIIYERLKGERGISRAFNRMLDIASGYLVMKVDDDDLLTRDAIETILKYERQLPRDGQYAGVSGLRMYSNGETIGSKWEHETDWIDCTNLERYKYRLTKDKAEAYYLKTLQEYGPMPTVPGEYYTWESVLWDRIAHAGKKIRWFNKCIYITEYLPGGATDSLRKGEMDSFRTYTIVVSEKMKYRDVPFIMRLKQCCRYFEIARAKKVTFRSLRNSFRGSTSIAFMGYCGSWFSRHLR